jgi:hypothetical protein
MRLLLGIVYLCLFSVSCNQDRIREQEKGGNIVNRVAADSTTSSCNAPSWITNRVLNSVFDSLMNTPEVDTVIGQLNYDFGSGGNYCYTYKVNLVGEAFNWVHITGLRKHSMALAPLIYRGLVDAHMYVGYLTFEYTGKGGSYGRVFFSNDSIKYGNYQGTITKVYN